MKEIRIVPKSGIGDEWSSVDLQTGERYRIILPSKKKDELSVTIVDELGQPLGEILVLFQQACSDVPAVTDSSGVAKCKMSGTDKARVVFADADGLVQRMKSIWTPCRGVDRKDWVAPTEDTTTVTLLGGKVLKAAPDPTSVGTWRKVELSKFSGVETSMDKPATISVQPLVIFVRMLGKHFDTDKCFLLPKALDSVQDLVRLHREYELTDLLIVGHTDTSATTDYNLDLSLERTSAMHAYLKNDADTWLAWYSSDKKQSKRWGNTEDTYMIGTLLTGTSYPPTVLGYQQWHNIEALRSDGYEDLEEDGQIGPLTRKQLILDYMHREDTTVPDETTIVVHGCGEYFPLDATGESLDANAVDGQHEQEDRRVEVFLFPRDLGMLPPVPGEKASKDEEAYPEWRRRSVDIELMSLAESKFRVRLHDELRMPVPADTPYRYTMAGTVSGVQRTLDGGWVEIPLPPSTCPDNILLEWGVQDPSGAFQYAGNLYVDCDSGDEDTQARVKLHNLGYVVPQTGSIESAVVQFQSDYGIKEHGLYMGHLPPKTRLKLWKIYATDCNATTQPQAAM